jgi:acylglycerol lipase
MVWRTIIFALFAISLVGCVTFDGDEGTPDASGANPLPIAGGTPSTLRHDAKAQFSGDRFIAADGTALPLRSWLPEQGAAAVILALHGFNDYSNAFDAPASALAAHGIAVYAYDQRGFGAGPHRGRWEGAERMAADAADAAAQLRRLYPDRPLFLLGESMGGAVAILAATGTVPAPVDGVILSAPAVWGRQTMSVFERVALEFARLMPSMQLSERTLPVTIMPSDNIRMLRALGADPLVIKTTRAETLNGLVDLMSAALAAAPRLSQPAFVLYGEHDEIVPRDPMERFVQRLPPKAPHRVALYEHGYHMLLRDLQASVVLDDITSWIRDRDAALPSGADRMARSMLGDREARVTTERRRPS